MTRIFFFLGRIGYLPKWNDWEREDKRKSALNLEWIEAREKARREAEDDDDNEVKGKRGSMKEASLRVKSPLVDISTYIAAEGQKISSEANGSVKLPVRH